jgi:hypothetical protein
MRRQVPGDSESRRLEEIMPNRFRTGWVFVVLAAVLAVLAACGDKKPETETQVKAKPKGPDHQVFAPLEKLTLEPALPTIIGADELFPCFKEVAELAPAEADVMVKDMLEKQNKHIAKLIREWFVDVLEVDGISPTVASKWTITPVVPVVLEVPRDQVRFTDGPECLSKKGWLPDGQYLAVALFGAMQFDFESTLPLNMDIQAALLEALGMKNIILESEALFVYEMATDETGEPMLTPEGAQLFTSPTGEFIVEADVPPMEKRLMDKWSIKAEIPLYFGYREIPHDAWRKESSKDKCNIILIPDQLDPQNPECAEFQEVGFSVTILEGDEKPVSLTMTLGEEDHKGEQLAWKEGKKVQVNDRMILWLKPNKVEVGVDLNVNSLVLDPQPMPDDPGGGGPAEEIAEQDKVEEQEQKKKEKDEAAAEKKKPKKKKGKQTDQDSLDDFLGIE